VSDFMLNYPIQQNVAANMSREIQRFNYTSCTTVKKKTEKIKLATPKMQLKIVSTAVCIFPLFFGCFHLFVFH